MSQCPFLSTVEEKVSCFKECAFYEEECSAEGCPFRKVGIHKAFNIKELLSFDIDRGEDELEPDFGYAEDFV